MKILYFDNFRGFESTFIALKDVNFFVGENSTGKTSILKLIGVMSSPGFWNYQQFDNNEINLGSFFEIKTSNSSKEFFEIGIFENSDNNISGIKLKFIEKDNFPLIKEICFINNDVNIQTTIDGKYLKYRFELIENKIEKDVEIWFKEWIKNPGLNDKSFLREEMEFLGIKSILFQLQSLIFFQNSSSDITKIQIPTFLNNIAWSEPVRTQPKKTYDSYTPYFSPDGSHSPYILKDIIKYHQVKYILNKFGSDSGLYDNIEINMLGDESKNDTPFEILITLNGKSINLVNVGYGVSQILPLLVEIIGRPEKTWFAIQQPEVHLHPRAQAAFGDFIYKSKLEDDHNFIIETHSDYTIDRYRLRINKEFREKDYKMSQEAQVIFFQRQEKGNILEIMPINSDGSYPDEQPQTFRDFFIKEQLELISI